MRFLYHYSVEDFSNTYILGPENGGPALIIDPGTFNGPLLTSVEDAGLSIKWVLITRASRVNVRGLRTLMKIYPAEIYSRNSKILEFPSHALKQGQKLNFDQFTVETLAFPEFSADALAFRLGNWLFPGGLLSAGLLGETANAFGRVNLQEALEKKLYSLESELLIFPGEGPPTTLRSEKLFNERLVRGSSPVFEG